MTDSVAHPFLPVNGHPDDDECTHREDGTDATYCGEPEAAHQPATAASLSFDPCGCSAHHDSHRRDCPTLRCVYCGPDVTHTNGSHRVAAQWETKCFEPSGDGPVCVGKAGHWQPHLANTPRGWIEW